MGGSLGIEPRAQLRRQEAVQRLRQLVALERRQRGRAGQRRREPVGCGRSQRLLGEIGPFLAFRTAQERDMPRGRILKDEGVDEIATQLPTDPAAFDHLRSTSKGFGASKLTGMWM